MLAYRERLTAPLSWWGLAVLFAVAVGWAFFVATPPWVAVIAAVVAAAAALGGVAAYGGAVVEVSSRGVRAGRALLPWSAVGAVETLDADQARRTAGVEADARAYLLLRGYCGGAVRVDVDDADDPTPYWLISSRRPGRLAEAIGHRAVQD